jgi:hypothetical protein
VKKLLSFFITLIFSLLLSPGMKPLSQFKSEIFPVQAKPSISLDSGLPAPACQIGALMVSASADLDALQQTIAIITARGGCVAHVFPPSALIGSLDPGPSAQLIAEGQLRSVYRKEVSDTALTHLGENTRLAAQVWNEYLREPELDDHTEDGPPGSPLIGDVRATELPFEPVFPSALDGPGFYDTSEYLYGKVVIGIIIPESSGAIDPSTENWSSSRMNQVVSEIAEGMNWYQSSFHDANLMFYYDIHRQVPTSYEPISRSSRDDYLWLHESLANLGVPGSLYSQAYTYLNQIRSTYQTDWAIVAFVADSLNDTDGKFTDGFFGYTYGYLIVLTYDNDGWGISRMDSVIAHEMAHNFGAGDEYCQPGYSCCQGGGYYGYLNIPNSNCEAGCDQNQNGICDGNDSNANSNCHNCPTCVQTSCIMRSGGVSAGMDSVSRWQIGARDTDGDGLYDPVDTFPSLILTAISPDPSADNTPTYAGSATDIPYDSPLQSDISVNYIKNARLRVDEGVWQDCIANDGAFNQTTENFTCTPAPLSDGVHTLQFQAINRVDQASSIWSDTVTIDATPPSNPISANPGCTATDNVWQNSCNDPNFTWSGASDAGSGVAGYYYYWGTDPNGTSTSFTTSAAYNPPSVTGSNSYYLRLRTRDNLGNNSAWTTLFTFKFDSVPPENPASLSSPDHSPSTWSNDNTVPIAWLGATDNNGSGAAGYSILWSNSPASLPDTIVDLTNTITTSLPLTDGSSWYFHLRTRDQVNLWASSALHSGPFFIDTVPPASFITNVSAQPCGLSFILEWAGEDAGSGLALFDLQYRVNTNGVWTDWLQGTTQSKSTFGPLSPGGPSTETQVYLRVRARDKAGNLEPYPPGDGDVWFVPQSTCLIFMPLTAK